MLVGANGASLGEYLIWNIQVELFYLKYSLFLNI
jgi:hypothetical protein